MQEPSYHLPGIVRSRDVMEDFSGPLDLILMLLSKNRIEIRDIQISSLLDQYLAYLDEMKRMDLEIASEFVQMASHLTYIKSRMLLAGDQEEVSELEELVQALEQMQNRDALAAVHEITPELDRRSREGLKLHAHEPLPLPGQSFEYHHTPPELLRALSSVLLRGNGNKRTETPPLRGVPAPIVFNIKEKSRQLIALLSQKGHMALRGLFALCSSRSELVATFLSLLELCSAGRLHVSGGEKSYEVTWREPEQEQNG